MMGLIEKLSAVACILVLAACSRFSAAGEGGHGDLPRATEDIPAPSKSESRTLVLAGGCFWGVEHAFEQIRGVSDVVSGYAGGSAATANYHRVSDGNTGHAEAIRITYDPTQVSYGSLLRVLFTIIDPTTLNRQGNDAGTQYRSAIFYANADEQRVAAAYIQQLNTAKVFDAPIATTVEPLAEFYLAEDYHQDYAAIHPNQSYIQYCVPPKMEKLRTHLAGLMKNPPAGTTPEPAPSAVATTRPATRPADSSGQ